MSKTGQLMTQESIERAQTQIREWLRKIDVDGLSLNLNYDAKQNISLIKFKYENKEYEFRSTKQKNCRLNMHAIARVMEFKVRAHLMGIELFSKSMSPYLMIEGRTEVSTQSNTVNEGVYVKLGLTSLESNSEIKARYRLLCKSWHPDMMISEEAKKEAQKKLSEINEAWEEIKKERGLL